MNIFSAVVLIILVLIFHRAILALLGPFIVLWILGTSIYGNIVLLKKWLKKQKEKDQSNNF